MPAYRSRRAFALLTLAIAAALVPASAQSRRDKAASEALEQRMAAAERRYADALVKLGNADEAGLAQSNAALEDMEDVISECARQRGCHMANLLATYKRLLKAQADAGGGLEQDDGDEGADAGHGATALAADVPEAARAAHLLSSGHRFDQMVQFNPAVQAGIRRWLTDMRGPLINSYENYQYMRQQMWPQFERGGLPEALLFGILAKESNGKVHSVSRAGAAGPLQFMHATGQRFGLGQDGSGFDTRYDPAAAAGAAARYLNERMRELNNSIEMALAAYNGGEGRALRVHRGAGGRGFWDADVYAQFPAETRDYVPMVIAAAWLYLHPKEYGLSLPRVDARPASLRLAEPASIYQLTICLGNRGERDGYMRALRNLNPRYEADHRLPAGSVLHATSRIVGLYNRHCVQGPRAALARNLVMSDPQAAIVRVGPVTTLPALAPAAGTPAAAAAPAAPRDYRVQGGETLTSIARKFSCSVPVLARENDIRGPRYNIRPGQTIRLAGCASP